MYYIFKYSQKQNFERCFKTDTYWRVINYVCCWITIIYVILWKIKLLYYTVFFFFFLIAQQGLSWALQIKTTRFLQVLKPVGMYNYRWRVGRTQIRCFTVGIQCVAYTVEHGRWHLLRSFCHPMVGKHRFSSK